MEQIIQNSIKSKLKSYFSILIIVCELIGQFRLPNRIENDCFISHKKWITDFLPVHLRVSFEHFRSRKQAPAVPYLVMNKYSRMIGKLSSSCIRAAVE